MSCDQINPFAPCGCSGNTSLHCDSTAFDSSCSDEGRWFPLSIPVGCALPSGYIPVHGIVGVWTGTEFLLDDSSSAP